MVRKIVSLLTVCLLAAALFCGCWGKDDSSSSSAQATPTPTTPSSGSLGADSMMPDGSGTTVPGNSSSGSSSVMPDESMRPDSGMDNNSASVRPTANWGTMLVNAENPLPGDFSVKTRSIEKYPDRSFDERAAADLEAMLNAAAGDGCPLYLVSTYRSVARQKALYERKVNFYLSKNYEPELAKEQAAKWVAAPGTSEHNLGLAADIVSAKWYNTHDDLTEEFEDTPEFEWLMAHCVEYGFVLRYPSDKTGTTGIGYEPWHYRYVGRDAAAYMKAHNLCLEELHAEQLAAG
ncbi:M15 family metallopeptidase [Pygmaiobacter massiliensis]|uniref:M15 family metallopeptidase n=1 Tax=Pygmaiobacter massiliensis TaxID=1917873 RepID=UPI002898A845|nr:M15 family metallopeptidase [Pygmaiobacter massiliensis]